MCGLVGAFRPTGGEVCGSSVLEQMRDRMAHRGPDGAGLWRSHDGVCGLAHRRLSIIDLSAAAAQPMANSDETVLITYNGEIYNHADIRRELESLGKYRWRTDHSDTEVLLHAYEEWGLDCVDRFHGMFAFAIFDRRDPSRPALHLLRDRMGIKPLYITRTASGEWLFASEIRALLAHPEVPREMDLTAFWHYLTFIVAPAPLTLFHGIFKLPSGSSITIDHHGRAVARRWWNLKPSAATTLREKDISFDEAAEEVRRLLKAAIARRMVADVPFGVMLSGGVDSSLNVALMSELMDRPVSTFTIGYQQYDDFNEFETARRIAKRYGTDHHERQITTREALEFLPTLVRLQDEPIADNVCIPLYFLSQLVKESGTTVVQVGEGADEHFLGYWWCEHYRQKYEDVYRPTLAGRRLPWWKRLIARGPRPITRAVEDVEIVRRAESAQELFWGGAACYWGEIRRKMTPDPAPFRQEIACPVEGLLEDGTRELDSHAVVKGVLGKLDRLSEPEVLQKIPYLESQMRIPEHLLMRVDKMTMAHAVEARVPFLDHELVSFATRLPLSYKLDGGVGKRVLKRVAGRYMDDDMVYRRKQGFGAPMDQWLAEQDFGSRCLAAFKRSRIFREGFLDNELFVGMLEGQMAGRTRNGFHLWTVLNAVLWHEVWIDRNETCL